MTKTVLLGDIAEINACQIDRKYPYDTINYIDVASVNQGEVRKVELSLSEAPSRAKRIVRDNDILISTVRPNLKHFAFIPKAEDNLVASTGFTTISGTQSVDPKYLYYYLTRDEITDYLSAVAEGQTTTFPAFRPEVLEKLSIPLPELDQQKEIGNTLYTLDQKIELNRRMNETLEKIGQTLFNHYFITNPDRKNWKTGNISEFAENIKINSKPPFSGKERYVALEHFTSGTLALYLSSFAGKVQSAKSRFRKGDLLFGKLRPYFHNVAIAPFDGVCSTDILVIRAKENEFKQFINFFFSQKALIKHVTNSSMGTRMPRTSWIEIYGYKFALPTDELLKTFNEETEPLVEQILNNTEEIKTLASLRDSLLPRLIS